jgi:hypothetical protein
MLHATREAGHLDEFSMTISFSFSRELIDGVDLRIAVASQIYVRGQDYVCDPAHRESLRQHQGARPSPLRAYIGKAKPRARLPLGVQHICLSSSIRLSKGFNRKSRLLGESACQRLLARLPTDIFGRTRECCGPDGIRTRTFLLDRQMCYQLHHGPEGRLVRTAFASKVRRKKIGTRVPFWKDG